MKETLAAIGLATVVFLVAKKALKHIAKKPEPEWEPRNNFDDQSRNMFV